MVCKDWARKYAHLQAPESFCLFPQRLLLRCHLFAMRGLKISTQAQN